MPINTVAQLISKQIDALFETREQLRRVEHIAVTEGHWAVRNTVNDTILKIEQGIYQLGSCLPRSFQVGIYNPKNWQEANDGGRVMRALDSVVVNGITEVR